MTTVAAHIYNAVKEQIIEGRYLPGARLVEQNIAAQFSTSRTPVREAMRLLIADGFVRFTPNSGSVVREWSREQMRQVFDARILIESEIAASAAQYIRDEQLAQLRTLQDEIEAGTALSPDEQAADFCRLNRVFHHVLARVCRNERLEAMLASAMEMSIVQQTFRRYTKAQLQRSFGHHRELIDALQTRDSAWARNIMACHIHSAKHAMLNQANNQAGNGADHGN